ncbi:Serine/threonine-protein kinase wnk3 [Actinomortierella wolfii]|nr:Serine/threonine-protein kinase wnk3 [Actinomortierella wolfii]
MASNVNQTDASSDSDDENLPVETDPTGRFQRCTESLGKGAYKHVYRAFDQEEGVEVAWNQLRISDLSKKEAQKILSEIEILQSIRNDHIINFYASWATKAPNGGERIVFITELMSSGTLKQYLKKTLKGPLKPKVLKSWCRQILQGLVYLHTHDPPIIHRDLKCDNIFINGNNGQLKIGDLGLAVLRHKTHVSSVLGTPEFMAPELYEEKYNEKVDIYAFGMCVLEMVTREYPYSECTNQAQIYRKVTQGIKPQSLEHVQDAETREFISRCLDHNEKTRPSAQELLDSDFLKPCAIIPPCTGNILGPYPCRSLEGHDMERSSSVASSTRSSFAEPMPTSSSTWTPVSTQTTLVTPVSSGLPAIHNVMPLLEKRPDPICIPTTEFTTTTTVDADNKTYHIRSKLVPNTPTSADPESENAEAVVAPSHDASITTSESAPVLEQATNASQLAGQNTQSPLVQESSVADTDTPTLHSHANNKTCSIQVIHHGDLSGNQLNLKMICTCPVAGTRDLGGVGAGTHEIKFPFDLNIDTAEEVVAEMIREQILSADDREEATRTIQQCIDSVLVEREQYQQLLQQQQLALARNAALASQQQDKSRHNRHAKHHQRQLNVPPVDAADYTLDQYGTSPTESAYDHYSSIGSTASTMWNGPASPSESDQGYATQPPQQHPSQIPPPITESTFPPLNSQATGPMGRRNSADLLRETQAKLMPASYSDIVQHAPKQPSGIPPTSTGGRHPTSPLLSHQPIATSLQRSQSEHQALPAAAGVVADAHDPAIVKKMAANGTNKGTLKEIETAAANMSMNSRKKLYDDDGDDVGYTSPFRHGVSSSSINYHRRSPSVEGGLLQQSSTVVLPSASISIPTNTSSGQPLGTQMPKISQPQVASASLPTQSSWLSPKSTGSTSPESTVLATRPMSQIELGQSVTTMTPMGPESLPPLTNGGAAMVNSNGVSVPSVALGLHRSEMGAYPGAMSTTSPPTSTSGGYFGNGSSSHSSGPEMSEDEDLLDEDLKNLREQQRREMELMRLQHLKQWETIMKLKEQKGERPRRKSDVESPMLMSTPMMMDTPPTSSHSNSGPMTPMSATGVVGGGCGVVAGMAPHPLAHSVASPIPLPSPVPVPAQAQHYTTMHNRPTSSTQV